MMKPLIALTLATSVLVGCSTISEPIFKFGKKINDDAIATATFALCYGSSVGSIRRSFTAQERKTLWAVLKCPDEVKVETPEAE
jgi:hypothetical protein